VPARLVWSYFVPFCSFCLNFRELGCSSATPCRPHTAKRSDLTCSVKATSSQITKRIAAHEHHGMAEPARRIDRFVHHRLSAFAAAGGIRPKALQIAVFPLSFNLTIKLGQSRSRDGRPEGQVRFRNRRQRHRWFRTTHNQNLLPVLGRLH